VSYYNHLSYLCPVALLSDSLLFVRRAKFGSICANCVNMCQYVFQEIVFMYFQFCFCHKHGLYRPLQRALFGNMPLAYSPVITCLFRGREVRSCFTRPRPARNVVRRLSHALTRPVYCIVRPAKFQNPTPSFCNRWAFRKPCRLQCPLGPALSITYYGFAPGGRF
jgi:hypothetical protein